MKAVLFLTLLYVFRCQGTMVVQAEPKNHMNDRPIIGILAQEQSYYLQLKYPEENYTSYIAASYVKDVESSGARVVPIMIGKDREYYEDILYKINGVLFPGGATYFNEPNGYADAGQHIYEIAKKLNDEGHYFPIFGTCLGFELIIILASGRGEKENRISCESNESLPLEFTKDFRDSRMFSELPKDLYHILSTKDVTANFHKYCITDSNMAEFNLTKDWRVMSYNYDKFGIKFISSIEHKRYPFYGVQFHPEKNAFEWKITKNYSHVPSGIRANRHFMDFFVNECRESDHRFASVEEENEYLIYKYDAKFTGSLNSGYEQCYLFEPRGNDNV